MRKNWVYITRREFFCAAHKLEIPSMTQEENESLFGGCANANWHGHNFELFITIKGTPDPQKGFVVNLKEVSRIMKERILDKVDHKNLNLDVDFMQEIMPSTENLAIKIWEQLEDDIKQLGATLHCVKLTETKKNSVEYYGKY